MIRRLLSISFRLCCCCLWLCVLVLVFIEPIYIYRNDTYATSGVNWCAADKKLFSILVSLRCPFQTSTGRWMCTWVNVVFSDTHNSRSTTKRTENNIIRNVKKRAFQIVYERWLLLQCFQHVVHRAHTKSHLHVNFYIKPILNNFWIKCHLKTMMKNVFKKRSANKKRELHDAYFKHCSFA